MTCAERSLSSEPRMTPMETDSSTTFDVFHLTYSFALGTWTLQISSGSCLQTPDARPQTPSC